MSGIERLLHVTKENRIVVRASFQKTDQELLEQLGDLKHWLKARDDIPHDIDDRRLFNIMARNKFKLDKVKSKLHHYYLARRAQRTLFDPEILHPKSPTVQKLIQNELMVMLPNLTAKGERIIFYKLLKDVVGPCSHISAFAILLVDIATNLDYSSSERLIIDIEGFKMRHWITYDVITLYKVLSLYKNGLSVRLAGMHILNAPAFIHLVLMVLKSAIKDGKIYVHNSLEELHEYVPQMYLPTDYGGKQGLLQDIQKSWLYELENQMDWVRKCYEEDEKMMENINTNSKHSWFASLFS